MAKQPAAELPARKKRHSRLFDGDARAQFPVRKAPDCAKIEILPLASSPSLDLIHDGGAGRILFRAASDLNVKEAPGLKVRDQVLLSLLHQVRVHRVFLVDGNLFLLSSTRDSCPDDFNANLRTLGDAESDAGALCPTHAFLENQLPFHPTELPAYHLPLHTTHVPLH